MTPKQHRAEAEALAEQAAGTEDNYGRAIQLAERAHVHAALGKTSGTGKHYEATEALLARIDSGHDTVGTRNRRDLVLARLHAELASS